MIRIMVVEDNVDYRTVIALAIDDATDMELIGLFGTTEIALRTLETTNEPDQPDILLLDLRLPGMSGLDALPLIHAASPTTRVIILSQSDAPSDIVQAISSGVSGYLLKSARLKEITEAIRTVSQGGGFLDKNVAHFILEKMTTKELGFKRVQLNSLYTQNSRGKYEMQVINTLKQSMLDVRKFSWDMSLFMSQEFNLLTIDKAYLTGSSIMPNKHNPDVIEILRANYSILAGQASELENIISLPSGYHRDLQLTKRSLVSSFDISLKSLGILPKFIKSIKVNKKNSLEYIDNEMKMTDKVYALVNEGTPFRDAYNKIKNSNDLSQFSETTRSNYSEGSPGNLKLNVLEKRLSKQR